MKSKIILIAFISSIVLLFVIAGTINYIERIPERLSAEYKEKIFVEIRNFIIEYPTENLTLIDIAFLSPSKYKQKLDNAIIDKFGEEKFELFQSMYDSMRIVSRTKTDSLFYGMEKEEVARDSLWQRFKRNIKDKLSN
jgi:hypothetical protein